ncbi:hypothetical protein V1387_04885 [Allomuricauda taeanensis]|uniref:hypothetical protein n=1 Tax=Flagellimonas taeanensis TaxID=1005926 RepID=UPI002E7BD5C0|nr:hypothetical protein [Allomuricauda taeanensis]MEE1962011.1 hypothetical protein [Allomuricauda taeanensis]
METIQIPTNAEVKLVVSISSDAIVGSYVSVNDGVVKRSQLYQFSIELGNINDLDNAVLSSVSNFFVSMGDIDPIMNNTSVVYTVKFEGEEETFYGDKVKISDDLFMAFFIVKLEKS